MLGLAVPAIISNITVPLLGLCDTAIAGHLGSSVYLAAIAAGSMMMNVIFFLLTFLRTGTTGLTAKAYGAGAPDEQRAVFSRSFFLAVAAGVAVILLGEPLCRLLSLIISAPAPVSALAADYFKICILGAPAQLGIMAANGWMVGRQSTVLPMTVSITVNIINIALSLAAVFALKWGFAGIAVGTMVSNWCGLVLALYLARRSFGGKRLFASRREVFARGEMVKFFRVNSDLFLRSACVMAVSLSVTSIGARLGADVLAVNAVINQFFIFFSYFMDGFAFAAEAMVGKAYGARDGKAMHRDTKALGLWSLIMAVTFTAIYLGFGNEIVALLTSEESVRELAAGLRLWIVALPAISVAAFIFDGFYIGVIATRRMLVSTATAMAVFFLIAFIHPGGIALPDNHTLWTAFLSYLLTRGVVLAWQWPKLSKCIMRNA